MEHRLTNDRGRPRVQIVIPLQLQGCWMVSDMLGMVGVFKFAMDESD